MTNEIRVRKVEEGEEFDGYWVEKRIFYQRDKFYAWQIIANVKDHNFAQKVAELYRLELDGDAGCWPRPYSG